MRAALAVLLLALPASVPASASAQIASGDAASPEPVPVPVTIRPVPAGDYELQRARDQIDDGRKNGTLSKRQARQLRREADRADALADRSARDGLSYAEQREIDMQGRALQSLTQAQRSQPGSKRP